MRRIRVTEDQMTAIQGIALTILIFVGGVASGRYFDTKDYCIEYPWRTTQVVAGTIVLLLAGVHIGYQGRKRWEQ